MDCASAVVVKQGMQNRAPKGAAEEVQCCSALAARRGVNEKGTEVQQPAGWRARYGAVHVAIESSWYVRVLLEERREA